VCVCVQYMCHLVLHSRLITCLSFWREKGFGRHSERKYLRVSAHVCVCVGVCVCVCVCVHAHVYACLPSCVYPARSVMSALSGDKLISV